MFMLRESLPVICRIVSRFLTLASKAIEREVKPVCHALHRPSQAYLCPHIFKLADSQAFARFQALAVAGFLKAAFSDPASPVCILL